MDTQQAMGLTILKKRKPEQTKFKKFPGFMSLL